MGDHDQRLPAALEVPGQPGDALDVEVVGRLVQHQQVGAGDQGRGQRDPAALAAGEPVGRACPGRSGQPEPGQHLADRGVAGPLVHLAVPRPGPRRGRSRRGGSVRWSTYADPEAAGAGDPAGVRRLLAGEEAQQRGLAAAVAADHAGPLARADAERDAVQHDRGRVRLGHVLQRDERGAPSSWPPSSSATTRAPGTGPYATRTVRQTPAPASAAASRTAASRDRDRNAQVGPEPETIRAERAEVDARPAACGAAPAAAPAPAPAGRWRAARRARPGRAPAAR